MADEFSLGLFFEAAHKVLLVSFSGVFSRDTANALNRAATATVERYGHVAVILDLTDVTNFSIALRDWPELGNNRRAIRGKLRMLVAPPTDTAPMASNDVKPVSMSAVTMGPNSSARRRASSAEA